MIKRGFISKTTSTLALGVFALVGSACGAADPSEMSADQAAMDEAVASSGQALCSNLYGTSAVEASLAVAAATELRRWNAPEDFQWNTTTGMLELSAGGNARCAYGCRNIKALLALQKPEANGMLVFPDGNILNSYTLQHVLKDHYDRQVDCNNYTGAYATNGCWVEPHMLSFWKKSPGTCATDNYFYVDKPGTTTALNSPERLNYQLYFVGYPVNPFLNFRNNGSTVVIDPTVGLTETDSTTSGSCAATCSQFSTTSVIGQCCSCNGVIKTFSRSPFSYDLYLCR